MHRLSRRLRLPVLALAALVLAAPAAAHADGSLRDRIDAVAEPAMEALVRAQDDDGTFADTTKGRVGANGLTKAGFAAAHQARRLPGDAGRAQLQRRVARAGLGGSNVLDKWALALWAADARAAGDPLAARLDANLRTLGRLHAPGVADACFQRPDCFNNYSLVSRVLDLELTASGLRSSVRGSRLARPGLRRDALRWLARVLPGTTSRSGRVLAPGAGLRTSAALSDPSRYPLAYQTLCTALLTRAVALGGRDTPKAVRALHRAALWELVAFTAPNGEVTWLGRGQDEVWTLAATLYAGAQGSLQVARTDPALAARLRRLVEVELGALRGRLTPNGLAQTALARAGRAGIDHYASAVGNAALALTFLELARDVAHRVDGTVSALPAERQGGRASDPRGNGLLMLRSGSVWLGVHRRRDHPLDARQDFGLLRALRRGPDGSWIALIPARPIVRPGTPSPSGGPLLVRHGRVVAPTVTSGGATARQIRLGGHWGGVPGRWIYEPAGRDVRLRSSCPRGATLQLTVYLPAVGEFTRSGRYLSRGGFAARFSRPISAVVAPHRYGSAREPNLTAIRVRVRCTGAPTPLTVTYSGTTAARG